jgi:rRNA biogenesis protein RRP5
MRNMGAIKRKAEGNTPSKKEKGASSDRSAKRRKSDVAAEPSPAKSKPESAAPKPSVFKDEEKSFPRGGASVLTPLEHKQIHIKANQDVLFEQSTGTKRTGGGGDDDGFSDMGSEDGEKAAAKSKKKQAKKSKKSHEGGEEEEVIRAEGLSYKVCQSQREWGYKTDNSRNCRLELLFSPRSPTSATRTSCSRSRTTSWATSRSPPCPTSSTSD